MRRRDLTRLLAALPALMLLQGCGQKGPLYLPSQKKSKVPPAEPPASPTPPPPPESGAPAPPAPS